MMMSLSSPRPAPLPEGHRTLVVTDGIAHPILFYDGVCGLCNRIVQFVLRHDPAGRFRFAPLQSDLARRTLERHHRDARDLDTVSVLLDAGKGRERLLQKSDAVVAVLDELGGRWRV